MRYFIMLLLISCSDGKQVEDTSEYYYHSLDTGIICKEVYMGRIASGKDCFSMHSGNTYERVVNITNVVKVALDKPKTPECVDQLKRIEELSKGTPLPPYDICDINPYNKRCPCYGQDEE